MVVEITQTVLDDVVRFSYTIKQCYGVPDEYGTIELSLSHTLKLPILPREAGMAGRSVKEFRIPKIDQTIAFIIESWRETSSGRMYNVSGPYLKPQQSPSP